VSLPPLPPLPILEGRGEVKKEKTKKCEKWNNLKFGKE